MKPKTKQNFQSNQKVMIRRLGDDKEYRAKVVGIMTELPTGDIYIVEMIDNMANSKWSHTCIPEVCLDNESWGFTKPTPPPTVLVTEGKFREYNNG